jgi:hypothetical protein
VLGANDSIVSTADLVVGVAGATVAAVPVLTAGVAGVVAGAVSMALGEYVSVSSQRDADRALLAKERTELARFPERELDALTAMYTAKGLTVGTARLVAEELTAKDAFAAHADIELQIGPDSLTNPRHAGGASAIAFTVGSLLPLIAHRDPAATTRREGGRDVCCRGARVRGDGCDEREVGLRRRGSGGRQTRDRWRPGHGRHLCYRAVRGRHRALRGESVDPPVTASGGPARRLPVGIGMGGGTWTRWTWSWQPSASDHKPRSTPSVASRLGPDRRARPGTGTTTPVVRRVCGDAIDSHAAHGGSAHAELVPGHGATFTVQLTAGPSTRIRSALNEPPHHQMNRS